MHQPTVDEDRCEKAGGVFPSDDFSGNDGIGLIELHQRAGVTAEPGIHYIGQNIGGDQQIDHIGSAV